MAARSGAKGGKAGTEGKGGTSATTIMWFRNDLRVTDNAALVAATGNGGPVLAVFVLDRSAGGAWAQGGAALWWLHASLASLAHGLEERGGALVLREGDAATIIPELARECGAVAVHCGRAHEPHARALDERVASGLPEGCALHHHRVATLFDFDAARTGAGGVYGVYTPFARACRALGDVPPPVAAPKHIESAAKVRSATLGDWGLLPTRPDWAGGLRETWTPGEAGAADRLHRFLKGPVQDYASERDNPSNEVGTSMLSPHLHWGEISPTQVWHAAASISGEGRRVFEGEILWHEFAAYTLWHSPHLPDEPLHAQYGAMPWRKSAADLEAWQQGRTGVPIVDAGMRQLWHTGWMHNRVRMITASFLVKHLLIAWQEGEAWFWDTLVDADLATNAMSWQWVAGSGADASPFFRIFNPVTQAKRFDPAGAYVKRWVPELGRLDHRDLHAPWLARPAALEAAGVALGQDYPRPIVDLDTGRDRALDAFRTHVKGASAKPTA